MRANATSLLYDYELVVIANIDATLAENYSTVPVQVLHDYHYVGAEISAMTAKHDFVNQCLATVGVLDIFIRYRYFTFLRF